MRLLGLSEDVGHQGVEQFDRVVETRSLQGMEQGGERGGAAWFLQYGQAGRLGCPRAARKPCERSCRQALGWRHGEPVTSDGVDAFQMPQQFGRRTPSRRRPQIVQGGERVVVGGDQGQEAMALSVAQGTGQVVPQPERRAVAHAMDQALQGGDAGQQNLVGEQPCDRPIEQQPWAIVPRLAQDIEPPGQPEPDSPFGRIARADIEAAMASVDRLVTVPDDRRYQECQIAWNRDPCFAPNTDPSDVRSGLGLASQCAAITGPDQHRPAA